jgi:WD repeat-containing protein 17
MAAAYEAKANELLTVSGFTMLGTVLMKKVDRQIEAAKIFFKIGKYKRYCDIMMDIGEYQTALSFAPLVSMKYW